MYDVTSHHAGSEKPSAKLKSAKFLHDNMEQFAKFNLHKIFWPYGTPTIIHTTHTMNACMKGLSNQFCQSSEHFLNLNIDSVKKFLKMTVALNFVGKKVTYVYLTQSKAVLPSPLKLFPI